MLLERLPKREILVRVNRLMPCENALGWVCLPRMSGTAFLFQKLVERVHPAAGGRYEYQSSNVVTISIVSRTNKSVTSHVTQFGLVVTGDAVRRATPCVASFVLRPCGSERTALDSRIQSTALDSRIHG